MFAGRHWPDTGVKGRPWCFRGLGMGIYTTNTPEACQYVAQHSQAVVIVVENHQQLQKITEVKDQLPMLKAVIQYTGDVVDQQSYIYSVSGWLLCD